MHNLHKISFVHTKTSVNRVHGRCVSVKIVNVNINVNVNVSVNTNVDVSVNEKDQPVSPRVLSLIVKF